MAQKIITAKTILKGFFFPRKIAAKAIQPRPLEILGTKETINGKEYYTVATDENGELTIDLPEGFYKAVEVEAEEKYDIVTGVIICAMRHFVPCGIELNLLKLCHFL